MKGFQSLTRWAAFAVLAVGVFEACTSTNDASTLGATNGPPSIAIVTPLEALGCDDSLVVHLSLNWTLKPPYNCGTLPNCGSVLVTLLETADGPPLLSARAATADVQLDLTDLVSPKTADAPVLSQVHFVKADLIGDSLLPFAGTQTSDRADLSLAVPTGCAGDAGAGAGGAAGGAGAPATAGAGGTPTGEGGASGSGGSAVSSEGGAGGEVAAAGAAAI